MTYINESGMFERVFGTHTGSLCVSEQTAPAELIIGTVSFFNWYQSCCMITIWVSKKEWKKEDSLPNADIETLYAWNIRAGKKMFSLFLLLNRLTSVCKELTFMRNVWKPYITCSASSHGCFSVHSARTNFTVLKQLTIQKEYVMSCCEIWLFPIWEMERPVALQDLLRIISQLGTGCI